MAFRHNFWNSLRRIFARATTFCFESVFSLIDHTTHKIGYFLSAQIARPPVSEKDPYPLSIDLNHRQKAPLVIGIKSHSLSDIAKKAAVEFVCFCAKKYFQNFFSQSSFWIWGKGQYIVRDACEIDRNVDEKLEFAFFFRNFLRLANGESKIVRGVDRAKVISDCLHLTFE